MFFLRRLTALALALPLAVPFLAGGFVAPAQAQDDGQDAVIVTVQGTPIRYSDVAMADEEMGAALARLEPEMRFQYLLGMLIDRRVVAEAARAAQVEDHPEVQRRRAYFGEKALRDFYWSQLMQDKVSDAAVAAWYETNIAKAPAEKEANARHILVQSRAEADKIAAEIAGGLSFDDAVTRYGGGAGTPEDSDLGWFRREEMVPAFGDAVFALQPGEISPPVQTDFGWHIIQLADTRALPKPSLEEAHEDIVRAIVRAEGQKLMEKMRADAKIDVVGVESAPSGGRPQIVPQAQ
ncbi:peptidyl-prolyl cis-trans isomerase [uncultured Parvibaculum sp.]|uniref:peptidylprolyl isomerase n=1 Tax=uncultured Parvibaculum sp. TaxID=291828 RepID=UPI0030DBED46|tara:strand:+ start:212863 stop:213744 length:882 start_codon:yes stop_codon:yes gene_type:complete